MLNFSEKVVERKVESLVFLLACDLRVFEMRAWELIEVSLPQCSLLSSSCSLTIAEKFWRACFMFELMQPWTSSSSFLTMTVSFLFSSWIKSISSSCSVLISFSNFCFCRESIYCCRLCCTACSWSAKLDMSRWAANSLRLMPFSIIWI